MQNNEKEDKENVVPSFHKKSTKSLTTPLGYFTSMIDFFLLPKNCDIQKPYFYRHLLETNLSEFRQKVLKGFFGNTVS